MIHVKYLRSVNRIFYKIFSLSKALIVKTSHTLLCHFHSYIFVMDSYVNEPNSLLKCSTNVSNVFVTDKKAEIISHDHVTVTKPNNICQCRGSHCFKKTDIKLTSINFSYDNMGYG
jgi:hypothetical protein